MITYDVIMTPSDDGSWVLKSEADAEIRKLKRALWLARALRAKECKYKYETWERHEERKVYKDYDIIAIVSRKARMWRKIERTCIKKAEDYK